MMKKLLFCLSAFALNFSVNAQTNWTSATKTTTTSTAVGIGTASPYLYIPLTVVNDGTSTYSNSQLVASFERLGAPDLSARLLLNITDFNDGFGDVLFDAQGNADIALRTKGGNGGMLVLKNNGNVGVAVTNPSAKLHVNGSLRFDGNGTTDAGYILTAKDASGNATWQAPNWIKNTTTNNVSYSGGNVGIGTDAPTTSLQVNAVQAQITLKSSGTSGTYGPNSVPVTFYYSRINFEGGNKYYIGKSWSPTRGDHFEIQNESVPNAVGFKLAYSRAFIGGATFNPNGGVQIEVSDTTSPILDASKNGKSYFRVSSKDGVTYAREIKVTAGTFPDYVFAKDYKLMPLNELENFITQNKHLPNINTAADVKENGLSLGEMQVKQMEKIEELTLYIIQLKKELDELKAENK